MKKIIHIIFYFSLLALPLSSQAEITAIEDTIEVGKVLVNIDSSLNGYVIAQQCQTCPKVRLKIDKNTRAIKKGKNVHLNLVNKLNGKYATVMFNIKDKRATKIIW